MVEVIVVQQEIWAVRASHRDLKWDDREAGMRALVKFFNNVAGTEIVAFSQPLVARCCQAGS